jgi:hypothetical protein
VGGDKKVVRAYINSTGFERWHKIYRSATASDSDGAVASAVGGRWVDSTERFGCTSKHEPVLAMPLYFN